MVDMVVELIPETQVTFALKAQYFLLAQSENHRAQNKHNSDTDNLEESISSRRSVVVVQCGSEAKRGINDEGRAT